MWNTQTGMMIAKKQDADWLMLASSQIVLGSSSNRFNQYFASKGLEILSDLEFVEKEIEISKKKEFVKIYNYMNTLPQMGGGAMYNITEDECLSYWV